MKAAYGAHVSLKEWNRKGWTYHAKGRSQKNSFVGADLILCERDVDTADPFVASYDDGVWFDQPELSIVESRHRVVVYHDDTRKRRK